MVLVESLSLYVCNRIVMKQVHIVPVTVDVLCDAVPASAFTLEATGW